MHLIVPFRKKFFIFSGTLLVNLTKSYLLSRVLLSLEKSSGSVVDSAFAEELAVTFEQMNTTRYYYKING